MTDLNLKNIRFDVDADGVATVLLDRHGEDFNSLGPELASDLFAAIERIEDSDEIKAVVIGSAKKDNFLSGADIRWLRCDIKTIALMPNLLLRQAAINAGAR